MKALFASALFLFVFCSLAHAADVNVRYENKTYHLTASFEVQATSAQIIKVITDFENLAQLNPAIIEVEVLDDAKSDLTKVRSVVKDCAIFFCKKITRVEHVRVNELQSVEAEVLPFLSDLREGYTKWEFQQSDEHTQVTYQATIQPKFWIPPLIRSRTVTKKIKTRMLQTVQRLQELAPQEGLP